MVSLSDKGGEEKKKKRSGRISFILPPTGGEPVRQGVGGWGREGGRRRKILPPPPICGEPVRQGWRGKEGGGYSEKRSGRLTVI